MKCWNKGLVSRHQDAKYTPIQCEEPSLKSNMVKVKDSQMNNEYWTGKTEKPKKDKKDSKNKENRSKMNTLDVINIDEELLADFDDEEKKIETSGNQILVNSSPISKIIRSGNDWDDNIEVNTSGNPNNSLLEGLSQKLKSNKAKGLKLKRNQISFGQKFSKERVNIKELANKYRGSNKDDSSFRHTNDTSHPEMRLIHGLISGKPFGRNSKLRINGNESMHSFV